MRNPQNILITGASSGLGASLALAYAEQGISLFLTGRNEDRLADIAAACRLRGAYVEMFVIDVRNRQAMQDLIQETDSGKPLDLVIANAGVSEMFLQHKTEASVTEVFSTNLDGVLNTVHPAMLLMKKRGKGQIAIISSLASFKGLPSAPAYSASKAAVRFYGEALRGLLKSDGIGVTVVCPGFIKTPMTDVNDFPMPMIISAEKAALKIKKRLMRNPSRIAFPWPFYFLMNLIAFLPPGCTDRLLANLPKKGINTHQIPLKKIA